MYLFYSGYWRDLRKRKKDHSKYFVRCEKKLFVFCCSYVNWIGCRSHLLAAKRVIPNISRENETTLSGLNTIKTWSFINIRRTVYGCELYFKHFTHQLLFWSPRSFITKALKKELLNLSSPIHQIQQGKHERRLNQGWFPMDFGFTIHWSYLYDYISIIYLQQ